MIYPKPICRSVLLILVYRIKNKENRDVMLTSETWTKMTKWQTIAHCTVEYTDRDLLPLRYTVTCNTVGLNTIRSYTWQSYIFLSLSVTRSINSDNQNSQSWLQISFFEFCFPEFPQVIQIMRVVNSIDISQFTMDNSPQTPLNKWDLNNSHLCNSHRFHTSQLHVSA
jgi:hypothetical protein